MKKRISILLMVASLLTLCGCRPSAPADTTPSIAPDTSTPSQDATQDSQTVPSQPTSSAETESARILTNIWAAYAEDERFAVYGGAVENSVADGPGDLDITNTEELTTRYMLPQEHTASVVEAASMVHLMNNNIFTAVVFRLADKADANAVAKALRTNVQENQWICGQPDKLLLADMGSGHLLMMFGSSDAADTFKARLSGAYANADILYDENIVA